MKDPLAAKVPEPIRPLFEHAQKIIQEHFSDRSDDPSKGTIEIGGERHILVSASSMSVDFYELIRGLFPDQDSAESEAFARNLLFDIAHALGVADARKFHKKLNLKDPVEKLSVGPIFFAYCGWAFVDIHEESEPSADQDYILVYDHPYSFESDAWIRAGIKSDFPVCIMNSGYSSGWCEESFGLPLVSTEIMCKAKGDDCCRFIMAPPERIDERIDAYLDDYPDVRQKARMYEIPEFFSRKKAEEKLARKEAQYRSIFEMAPTPFILSDMDGLVLDANPSALDLFGLEGLGEHGVSIDSLFEDPSFNERLSQKISQGISLSEQISCSDKNSNQLELDVRGISFPYGKEQGLLILIDDRTETVRAEIERERMVNQMQHAQKLESLGILTGGIAHDFNNLLLTIMGNAHIALNKVEPDAQISKNIQKILTASKAASDLTNQMLVYSGKGRMSMESLNLTGLVREMGDLLKTAISHRVNLKYECSDNLPKISGDPSQLRQVIMNFIINASDAIGEERGDITVRISQMIIDENERTNFLMADNFQWGACICLDVEDTGSGMTPETIQNIFDPFYTTKFVGRGLGLAAVLGIIRSHGGCIRVTSTLGQGSLFRVLLPIAEIGDGTDTFEAIQVDVDRGSFRILIVDDEQESREIINDMVEENGWQTETAASGHECLKMVTKDSEFDAILLDLSMPDMSGEEVHMALQSRFPELPVIICTGYSEMMASATVRSLDENHFLQKPFGPGDIDRALVTLLK